MAELVDALDLGSSEIFLWEFESPRPHSKNYKERFLTNFLIFKNSISKFSFARLVVPPIKIDLSFAKTQI